MDKAKLIEKRNKLKKKLREIEETLGTKGCNTDEQIKKLLSKKEIKLCKKLYKEACDAVCKRKEAEELEDNINIELDDYLQELEIKYDIDSQKILDRIIV